jgi:hypothetical protein
VVVTTHTMMRLTMENCPTCNKPRPRCFLVRIARQDRERSPHKSSLSPPLVELASQLMVCVQTLVLLREKGPPGTLLSIPKTISRCNNHAIQPHTMWRGIDRLGLPFPFGGLQSGYRKQVRHRPLSKMQAEDSKWLGADGSKLAGQCWHARIMQK